MGFVYRQPPWLYAHIMPLGRKKYTHQAILQSYLILAMVETTYTKPPSPLTRTLYSLYTIPCQGLLTRAHMAVDQNPCCRGAPPPLSQTFVAGPLLQTLVEDLCVEYCSLQGACRGGVCRKTPPSVTNLCREMAAQSCYKQGQCF